MPVLSVDLAYKSHRDLGIAVVHVQDGRISGEFIRPERLGLSDPPEPAALARHLVRLRKRWGCGSS